MTKLKRIIAVVVLALATLAAALPATAAPECSPGQHGNPHPGFKPGVCG